MTPDLFYREITLTQGQVAVVNSSDYDWLNQWKWMASWDRFSKSYYALRHSTTVNGKRDRLSMHRTILGLSKGDPRKGDHINRDTLDNRRENLRVATRSENQQNRKKNSNNTSGYKGVFLHRGKWEANISIGGRQTYLGTRPTAKQAHEELYVPAALKHYGEFARLA